MRDSDSSWQDSARELMEGWNLEEEEPQSFHETPDRKLPRSPVLARVRTERVV